MAYIVMAYGRLGVITTTPLRTIAQPAALFRSGDAVVGALANVSLFEGSPDLWFDCSLLAWIIMAYAVMAWGVSLFASGLDNYGLCSYGLGVSLFAFGLDNYGLCSYGLGV